VLSVLAASIASPTLYFILSNLVLWAGGGGLQRPKTLSGLLMCYNDALPFYPNSVYATVLFSSIFFGVYYLIKNYFVGGQKQLA
jgi:hypothetical protein